MPSLWAEPFGLLGIEAGCVGLPAAGYAVGGIPDWLVPGETGESGSSGQMVVAELAAAIRPKASKADKNSGVTE